MQNIEYLSERDLEYFEKKEALGEAIIIRIEPEILLSLDLDALFQNQPKDQTLSAEELESFLYGSPSMKEGKGSSGLPEEHETCRLENTLLKIQLSPEKQQNLIRMINAGTSDEELMKLIKEGNACMS